MQLSFDNVGDESLCQFFTPEWAAVELIDRFFPDLSPRDLVLEPSCGTGSFLKAIPDDVPAIGVEIDPVIAQRCRENTNRQVITGDFRHAALPAGISVAIGNPPFSTKLITSFLHRLSHLEDCRRCGFLLPAYATQTHGTVEAWRHRWSLRAEIIPRQIFPGLSHPLIFVCFEKNARREMVGFALFDQAVQFDRLAVFARQVLVEGRARRGAWRALVDEVLGERGEADLAEIYAAIEPRRPTENAWWKEKVRQVLQLHFERVGAGRYRRQAA